MLRLTCARNEGSRPAPLCHTSHTNANFSTNGATYASPGQRPGNQSAAHPSPERATQVAAASLPANADPIWLQQNEMWEYMQPEEAEGDVGFKEQKPKRPSSGLPTTNEDLPF